jgi:hypothetical protein
MTLLYKKNVAKSKEVKCLRKAVAQNGCFAAAAAADDDDTQEKFCILLIH